MGFSFRLHGVSAQLGAEITNAPVWSAPRRCKTKGETNGLSAYAVLGVLYANHCREKRRAGYPYRAALTSNQALIQAGVQRFQL